MKKKLFNKNYKARSQSLFIIKLDKVIPNLTKQHLAFLRNFNNVVVPY